MKNVVIKISVWLIILNVGIFLAACGTAEKNSDEPVSTESSILDFTSDTQKAVNLVEQANTELLQVRKVFQASQDEQAGLYEAVSSKDIKRIKELCEKLKQSINDGLQHAENALSKIEAAQNLKINDDFKDYLDLKTQALKKQIEAFKIRHELARLLRDQLDVSPNTPIQKITAQLKEKEVKFTDTFSLASDFHDKANELFREKNPDN